MAGETHCHRCGGPFLIGGLRVTEPDGRDRHYVGHCREPEHPRPLLARGFFRALCGHQWQTFIPSTVSHTCGRWRWHGGPCECRYCAASLLRAAGVDVTVFRGDRNA